MSARAALVVCGDADEAGRWAAASRSWLGPRGVALWRDPDTGATRPVGSADGRAADLSGGLTVCRSAWTPTPDFGEAAAAAGAVTAMGRLLRPRQGEDAAGAFEDVAPAMIARNVTRFEVSPTVHGALCARLPLECLWAAPDAARRLMAVLATEPDAARALAWFYDDAALRGAGMHAYLPAMAAVGLDV